MWGGDGCDDACSRCIAIKAVDKILLLGKKGTSACFSVIIKNI